MATTPYGVRLGESAPSEMDRSVTTVLSRAEIEQAARSDASAELMLDIHRGDGPDVQAHTLSVVWTREDLEKLLEAQPKEDITISFDREQLEAALEIEADVEAHGLRQKALIFTVLVGTAAAAPTVAQAMPTGMTPGTQSQAAPAVLVGGAQAASDIAATPAGQMREAPAVVTGGATPAADQAVASGPGTVAPAVLTGGATPAADQPRASAPGDIAPAVLTGGAVSAAQQATLAGQPPAVVTGGAVAGGATYPTPEPNVVTSTGGGSNAIDPAEALLIGGGAALAIAAAGFAATRRPSAPRPA
jgi:hypothetical protein